MDRTAKLLILAVFGVILLLPLAGTGPATVQGSDTGDTSANDSIAIKEGQLEISGIQDQASWWNSSYIYRRYYNFTEPGVSDRTLATVHLDLDFVDGHCYRDSIRVLYYNNGSGTWTELPFQVWDTAYYSADFIESAMVTFSVNLTMGTTDWNYYVYYAKVDVGTVDNSDYYPFVYKSYTFSMINLISHHDDNNYYIELWDDSSDTWDDPRNLDTRWAGTSGSVYPSDVPSGTLDTYEFARYEPSSYSYSLFHGFYAVHSNYPMSVQMGQGNEGNNPAINDWFPMVSEMSLGTGTEFMLGGVEGFDDRNEGTYWVQATDNNTEVYAWDSTDAADSFTLWEFYNGTAVTAWPAILAQGEYIAKRQVDYNVISKINSTKPVVVRAGDVDSAFARDVWAAYPSINGDLAGEEFFTIDMGNGNDWTRVTNLGETSVQVDWRRLDGSGWGIWTTITVNANSSQLISRGVASDSNPEDVLQIRGESGAMLMVEGLYDPNNARDEGDWMPTTSGDRFGTNFKVWGTNSYKFMVVAQENAYVEIEGYNDGTLEIPAGGAASFRPVSSSMTLYHITSNATISVVDLGRFSTSAPYNPTSDTGYGWAVPAYHVGVDQAEPIVSLGEEIHLFEFDITVEDMDGVAVEGAKVTLYNSTTSTVWIDDNGLNRSGLTDSNGLIIFEGLNDGNYIIRTEIDAAAWLTTSYSELWVRNAPIESITGPVTPVTVNLPMKSFDVYMEDLMGDAMAQTPDETTSLRLSNESDSSIFSAQASTDASGTAHFYRVPSDDYTAFASYNGNVTSYTYDQIADFGSWSIPSSDFDSNPLSYSWTMPLVTLRLNVMSWDDQPVEDAYIEINNTVNEPIYQLTMTTDSDGEFNFYRVVNGTWNIDCWIADDYPDTPTARNNTETLTDVQGLLDFEVELPISRLIVRVQTGLTTYVESAQVNVTLRGDGLIAQGTTNSTGHVTFFFIHANMSSPYSVSYNLTVKSGNQENGTLSELLAKCDKDWQYINVIYIATPTYNAAYTELNSTQYYFTKRWGQNASFTVGYYDRIDNPPYTQAVSPHTTTWINFTIYSGANLVGWGTWNSSDNSPWVTKDTEVNFTFVIDSDYWLLNATETPYLVYINAHNDNYDDPARITIYVTIQNALTQEGKETDTITEYYKVHGSHTYWLYDSTNDENVTELMTYSYTIKLGAATKRTGTLQQSGSDYILPASAAHGLAVGAYTVTIQLEQANYVSQTIVVDLNIEDVPMQVEFGTDPSNYDWSELSDSFDFEYIFNPDNSTDPALIDVTVTVQWIDESTDIVYSTYVLTLSQSGGVYVYDFDHDIVPVGNWIINVTCTKANYETAFIVYDYIVVDPSPTTIDTDPSGNYDITVDWGEIASFDVYFERTLGTVGLEDADYSHNWTKSVSIDDLGSGYYRLDIGTLVQSGTYTLRLTLSMDNHDDAVIDLEITVRIPLLIDTEYGSAENPLQVYWTRTFDIEINLYDQSRSNSPVDGATVSFNWYLEFVVDQSGGLDPFSGGIYNTTLNAFDAVPMDDLYSVVIAATKADATTAITTVFVKINAVPNEIVLDTQFFEQYYADVFNITFFWNNTLDNDGIESPDSALYELLTLSTEVTSAYDLGTGYYAVEIDTKALSMNANEKGSVYVVQLTLEKNGYQAHELTTVIILVSETDASLVIDPIDNVNWSDSIDITARLYDALHGGLIWDGATVTVSWGTEYSEDMVNNGDGTFTVSFASDLWFAARSTPYNLTFTYELPNFVDNTNMSTVTIDPIPGEIYLDTPDSLDVTVKWSEDFDIRVAVNNIYGATADPIRGATVYYSWSGQTSVYMFSYNSITVDYDVTVSSYEVAAGAHQLVISVDNENYTIADVTLDVAVQTVDTALSSDALTYTAYYDVTTGVNILLDFEIEDPLVSLTGDLTGATISMEYGGTSFTATYQSSTGQYQLTFNPSAIDASYVPGLLTLNITATLENYTMEEVNPTLYLLSETTLAGQDIVIEEGNVFTLWFQYYDVSTDSPIGPDTATSITLTTAEVSYSLDDFSYNGSHYSIVLSSDDVGVVRPEPYQVLLSASAPLHRNQTDQAVSITISELTIDVLGLGFRVPVSLLNTILLMSGLFIVIIGLAIGVQRWRIPYQIKQINKAVKDIENNKKASVEGISTMGKVVSELLAPGLADLDITPPVIDEVPISEYEEVLGEQTEDLLGELDALDDIGDIDVDVDEDTSADDFEAELTAELDSIVEDTEEPEAEIEAEDEPEGAEVDAEVDEPEPEVEPESEEAEAEVEEPEAEPEPEETETAEELETDTDEDLAEELEALDALDEPEPDAEAEIEKSEADAEVETEPESEEAETDADTDDSDPETQGEEEVDEETEDESESDEGSE